MNESKSTRYHRQRRRAEGVALVLRALLLVGAGVALGSGTVTLPAAGAQGGRIWQIVWMAGGLGLLAEAITFPCAWYVRYRLARRYRASREVLGAWLRGQATGSAIRVTGGVVVGLVVYALIARRPSDWWVVGAGIYVAAVFGLSIVGPIVVLPRIDRLRPLSRAGLRDRLERLVARAGLAMIGCYEWRSRGTGAQPAAALVGVGAGRRVLLSETLVEDYADDEIEVIVAHELSHQRHHDLWSALALHAVSAGLVGASAHAGASVVAPAMGVARLSDPAGFPWLVLTAAAACLAVAPLRHAVSRRQELRADREAVELTGRPEAMLSGLRRLAASRLAEERPSRLTRWFRYSHPPVADRLAAVVAVGRTLRAPAPADQRFDWSRLPPRDRGPRGRGRRGGPSLSAGRRSSSPL